jgi:hypothetical protein
MLQSVDRDYFRAAEGRKDSGCFENPESIETLKLVAIRVEAPAVKLPEAT